MAPKKANTTDGDFLYRFKLETRCFCLFVGFFGMFLTINVKAEIHHKSYNPKDNETEFAFGLQIDWNVFNSNQSTSKTSSYC